MSGEPANVDGTEDFALAAWETIPIFTDRWAAKCGTDCAHPYMVEYSAVSPAEVPEPATLLLLLTGAATTAALRRRSVRT
jgi:hypothetical protein